MPIITQLYRYPIKGLSPEILSKTTLSVGNEIALDRRFALAHGTTEFNPQAPSHLPKIKFLMLMKNERLAALQTRYDEHTKIVQIFYNRQVVAEGNLETTQGCQTIEQFFADYLGDEIHGFPKLVQAVGHTFSDVDAKVLSCINLATLRELEKIIKEPIHPLRFRANVYFDEAPPWAELTWVDRTLDLGTAKVQVVKPIERCAATNVNPVTAERDLTIPQTLIRHYGHRHLGIYVRVVEAGEVAINDPFNLLP